MASAIRPSISVIIAIAVALAAPIAWTVLNSSMQWTARPTRSELAEPFIFFITLATVSVAFLLVAYVIRRRPWREAAAIIVLVQLGGLLAVFIALAAPMLMPTGRATQFEPTPVDDRTAFAKAYRDMTGGGPAGGEHVVRRSWALDEYGVIPERKPVVGDRWVGYWEEYGLPFRCLRSPVHFGLPRPARMVYIRTLPEIFAEMRLRAVPFAANSALYAMVILTVLRGPRWIRERHRSQADCCPKCGYFVRDLPQCPECGVHVRRDRRGVRAA